MATKTKKASGLSDRFSLASEELTYRTVASIQGEVGTGKTYFCLTGPGPIVVQDIDQGTEGVVEQFRKDGKEIYHERYVWSPRPDLEDDDGEKKDLQEYAVEIRNRWEKDFRYAVNNGARTVIWDTESRIWQAFRYAEFGSPNGDNPRDYDQVNQRFESMINDAKASGINLFMIRSMKDSWGMVGPTNAKTGKKQFGKGGREVWGYDHLPGIVFMEMSFRYDKDTKEYLIDIGKCRHNLAMQYTSQPRCTFPELGTLLIEDTKESDWA